jgi:lysophospholipase L1-like esterase
MKQIILLGDSIRMQYQPAVGRRLADIAEVSGPEENCRWSGYLLNSLRFWLPKMPEPDIVHWNAGIWDMGDDYGEGRHFYPLDLYEETCHRICRVLRKVIRPDLTLVIATSTPTMQADHQDVGLYNEVLRRVAAEEKAVINDLYSVVAPAKETMICEDHIHLSAAGIEAAAEQTAAVLRRILEGKKLD